MRGFNACFKLKLILLLDKIVGDKYFSYILRHFDVVIIWSFVTDIKYNFLEKSFPHFVIAYVQMKRGDGVFFFGFPLLQSDLEVAVQTSTVGDLRGRNILRALFHPIFNEIGKHDNHFALLLPYHPPKVGDSRLHWRLASDVIFRRVLWPLKNRQRIKKKKKKKKRNQFIRKTIGEKLIVIDETKFFHPIRRNSNPRIKISVERISSRSITVRIN